MSADVQATFCATLVDQWARHGLLDAMVAPGSRSTPMAVALADHPRVRVHVFVDERSAAFAALGAALAGGRPSVVLCTSGTAATHFHGAVVEADLSGVPLLVLTADRPPELQNVGAPQTIDQTELYGNAVRWYHDPGVPSADTASRWRVLADEAWWAANSAGNPGPVHLNLPFREPLLGRPLALPDLVDESPSPPEIVEPDLGSALAALDVERGLVIAGRGAPRAAVAELAAKLRWPVLADPRSGCRGMPHAVSAFDALLRDQGWADAHRPDAVLHIGEPPASKVLGQWLQSLSVPQVHVHLQPRVIDPLGVVTTRVVGPPAVACLALCRMGGAPDGTWSAGWTEADGAAQLAIERELGAETALSEPLVARVLTGASMPAGAQLVVSSSMPIRDVEWFGTAGDVAVHANRGANGIDGVLATAIGVAVATQQPTVALLGDVAFCHDASSLTALAGRSVQLTVVVIDNDGGGIFSFLPQAAVLAPEQFEQLFGTPHGTDLLALAAAHGLATADVVTEAELVEAIRAPGVSVVRVRTGRDANVALHDRLNAAVAAGVR